MNQPEFREMSVDELRSSIKVKFARNEAMVGEGMPMVVLQLPSIGNTAYATVTFSEFKLSKADEFDTQSGGVDYESFSIEQRFYAKGLEKVGTTIKGEATVNFPRTVENLRVERDKPKDSSGRLQAEFNGPKVTLLWNAKDLPGFDEDAPPFLPAALARFAGLNESGEYIKSNSFMGGSGNGDRKLWVQFEEAVHALEARHPLNFTELKTPIDVGPPGGCLPFGK